MVWGPTLFERLTLYHFWAASAAVSRLMIGRPVSASIFCFELFVQALMRDQRRHCGWCRRKR
jgi:hypothetical protein